MSKRQLADRNLMFMKGKVVSTRLYDSTYPAVYMAIDTDGGEFSVKVPIDKDGMFFTSHAKLVGQTVSISGSISSWEKEGAMNYGLQAYEKGVVMNRLSKSEN